LPVDGESQDPESGVDGLPAGTAPVRARSGVVLARDTAGVILSDVIPLSIGGQTGCSLGVHSIWRDGLPPSHRALSVPRLSEGGELLRADFVIRSPMARRVSRGLIEAARIMTSISDLPESTTTPRLHPVARREALVEVGGT